MGVGLARTYLGASVGDTDFNWHGLDDESQKVDGVVDPDAVIEIDHKLRNHGLMKAGRHEFGENKTARDDARQTRHILIRQTLDPNKTYYVRFKSVLDTDKKELYLDYFEWCPKEIFDNPSNPEDVW